MDTQNNSEDKEEEQNELLDVRVDRYKYVKHFCKYGIIKKTIHTTNDSKSWVERCRCGRFKTVDYRFFIEGSKYPKFIINFFDRNGERCQVSEKEKSGANPSHTLRMIEEERKKWAPD